MASNLCDYAPFSDWTNHGPAKHSKGGYDICDRCYKAIVDAERKEAQMSSTEPVMWTPAVKFCWCSSWPGQCPVHPVEIAPKPKDEHTLIDEACGILQDMGLHATVEIIRSMQRDANKNSCEHCGCTLLSDPYNRVLCNSCWATCDEDCEHLYEKGPA